MNVYVQHVNGYLKAKDENKPNLMESIFEEDAVLIMNVQSQNIDFPSRVQGCAQISKILVEDFAVQYEDVYSFCLEESLHITNDELSVDWFVCMRDKKTKDLKLGQGKYKWQFNSNKKVKLLEIDINKMHILLKKQSSKVFEWINKIPTKWVLKESLVEQNKNNSVFEEIKFAIL